MATLLKKLSIKTVCGSPEREVLGQDSNGKDIIDFKEKDMMQIVGIATSTRTGTTNFGEYVGLRGSFQATNLETGEVFRSAQCFLPNDVTDMISVQLAQGETKSVQFAFNIGLRARPDTAKGYEYTARPLMDAAENDPLQAILERVKAPQLEVVKDVEPEATKAKAKAK